MGLSAFNRLRKMNKEKEQKQADLLLPDSDSMTDERLAETAPDKGGDLGKHKTRTKVIGASKKQQGE